MIQCDVKGCKNWGASQICPTDGRVHYHGGIHPPAGWKARIRDDVWPLRICDAHIEEMRREVEARDRPGPVARGRRQ